MHPDPLVPDRRLTPLQVARYEYECAIRRVWVTAMQLCQCEEGCGCLDDDDLRLLAGVMHHRAVDELRDWAFETLLKREVRQA